MQYYYGEKNILRALDEAEFWKHQEAEHTDVIKAVTPGLEKIYVEKLNEFGASLRETYENLVKYTESTVRSKGEIDGMLKNKIADWLSYSVGQSEQFICFLAKMLTDSRAVRDNAASAEVIRHIIRESQYFIGIIQLIL